jgi:hypothetical protein
MEMPAVLAIATNFSATHPSVRPIFSLLRTVSLVIFSIAKSKKNFRKNTKEIKIKQIKNKRINTQSYIH